MTNIPFRIDPHPAKMEPSSMVEAEVFTTSDHTELNHTHYINEDETTYSGVWECAPTREVIDAYPVHELMTIVSGKITVTHADGTAEHLGAGDSFYIAKGKKMVWEITETLRKIYMITE
ncbi:DUF861 domain-containing protein [Roseovarius sp. LXJ103]|uniref:cupin domain-containing protein n=1 Tax=Roseovarius carneus TaxID=2853164 RepID=UPI000D60E3C5|nr:cupin domain-containing protein [Roseovarius carneus]MBZ8117649.1 DUF861 domain-containing protein [Roseovarius carneus]PWE36568.1 cupin [Pelagicola sp. LXJ1103]